MVVDLGGDQRGQFAVGELFVLVEHLDLVDDLRYFSPKIVHDAVQLLESKRFQFVFVFFEQRQYAAGRRKGDGHFDGPNTRLAVAKIRLSGLIFGSLQTRTLRTGSCMIQLFKKW